MSGLLWTLIPLILGNILVPSQIAITLLLVLRPSRGPTAAAALIAGIFGIRLVQVVIFGLVATGVSAGQDNPITGPVVDALLVVVGLVLYAAATKMLLTDEDPDAPPPRWMTMASSMSPRLALGVGAALPLVGPKFWVFTLSATAAAREAGLGYLAMVLVLALYAALSCALLIAIVAIRLSGTPGALRALQRSAAWLERHTRIVAVVLGAVFGTWFLATGLAGLL